MKLSKEEQAKRINKCKGKSLAELRPDLAKEWDYEKNEDLTPEMVTCGSGTEIWWLCDKGHEYVSKPNSRKRGDGCYYCSGHRVLSGFNDLYTKYPLLASEWDYSKNEVSPQQILPNCKTMYFWKCKKGHSFQCTPNTRVNMKSGCPYCSGRLPIIGETDLATTHPELAKEWHPTKNGNLTPQNISYSSNKPVWWLCDKGHAWTVSPNARKGGKHGCPYCSNRKVLQGYNDLATTHPNLVKEWDYEKNNQKSPYLITYGNTDKVWWICNLGHSYIASPNARTNNGVGCPYCTHQKVLPGFNDFATLCPDLCKEWDYEKNIVTPTSIFSSYKKKIWWLCNMGHSYSALISNRKLGTSCPYCSGSKSEKLTYKILKAWNIPFKAEKKFDTDISIKYYPFDIWIASKRLIIELDGLQHFTNEIPFFEQTGSFEKRRQHDNLKNKYCLENKIPILRIPYTYNPDTEEEKIRDLLKEFIETRKVPQEIIEYYKEVENLDYFNDYEVNNYAEIATQINQWIV